MFAVLLFLAQPAPDPVPEPALLALLAVGAGIIYAVKRRK